MLRALAVILGAGVGLPSTAGCYLFHERPAEASRPPDAGAAADADAAVDGGTVGGRRDAGAVEPLRCSLSPGRELMVASDPDGSMTAPDLFLAGDRLGVLLFHSDTVGHPVVSMAHADPALGEVSALRQVGEESHGWGEAAWTGDAVGVCWHGDPDGLGKLRFREVAGLDGPLGPRTDFEVGDSSCLDLEFAHGRYAMTWRAMRTVGPDVMVDTAFQVMARDGSQVGERLVLATAPYPGRSAEIVPHPEGFLYVVADGERVRLVLVDPAGAPLREGVLAMPGASFAHADLRDGILGVATLQGPPETRSLVFTRVSPSLRPLDERLIDDGAPTASYPRVLARPEGFVLLWGQGSRPTVRTVVLSLDPDGVPIAPRRVLYEGPNSSYGGASLVSAGSAVYVGLSHPSPDHPTGRENLYVQRWECDGPAGACAPEEAQAGDCAGDRVWGWRWTGDRCEPVVGCASDCIGRDCDGLAGSRFACESDRRECGARECTIADAFAEVACGPIEVASNESAVLRVTLSRPHCPCVPPPTCRVRVSGPSELTLDLVRCDEITLECDCAPGPVVREEVACLLPPLQAGPWVVRGRDAWAFEVLARSPWETPSDEALCRGL